jgi:branched-chain amino acid transport system substrate-binding protein
LEIYLVRLLGKGNSVFNLGDKMKNIKSIAGVALLAMMATSSHAAKSVTVGELQGFTGPLESMIGAMSGGANLAVTEANASGAFLQGTINVVQGDSVCIDAAVAIAQAEKMVNEDNVMAIMGPNCSGNTIAVIEGVIVPNGIVSISPSATSPAIDALDDGGFFFRTAAPDTKQGPMLAKVAMARGQTDMAVTHSNSDYGKALADAFVAAYEGMGGTVTVLSAHEDDKADYSADVAALSAGGSATLAVLGYADTGGRGIIAASEDTGAFSDYVFGDGMISEVTAGAIADGSWGAKPSPSAELQAAWEVVATAGGVDGKGVYSGESYDAMALIILAAQAAGSTDRAAIQAQVMNVANAPGIQCAAGDLGTCLKYISGGLPVDYVGATGVELDAAGTPNGSYAEQEVIAGAFTTVTVHN